MFGFQRMLRLSLPLDNRRLGSCLHQERERMPLSWPERMASGARAFLKFQSMMTGEASSSEAVIMEVG